MNSAWTSLLSQHYFIIDYTEGEEGRKAGGIRAAKSQQLWCSEPLFFLCLNLFTVKREHGAP